MKVECRGMGASMYIGLLGLSFEISDFGVRVAHLHVSSHGL